MSRARKVTSEDEMSRRTVAAEAQGVELPEEPSANDIDTSTWPDSLVRLAEVVGSEAALKLIDHFGGTRAHYIAREVKPNHPWAQLMGIEAYDALVKEFGGQQIDLPRFHFRQLKKQTIIDLWENTSLSKRQIALKVRATEGYVHTVTNQLTGRPRQMDLFKGEPKR